MNLDPDLLRIFNPGAKIYDTKGKRQGKVYSANDLDVMIDYGKGKYDTYTRDEFTQLLTSDVIVANSRVTLGNGESFKIKPREISHVDRINAIGQSLLDKTKEFREQATKPQPDLKEPCLTNRQPAEIGYINFPTGRFSVEPKKGYTKVEYRKAVEKVTLEVDSEMMEKLREMGLLK
jgi:hypothetical protein